MSRTGRSGNHRSKKKRITLALAPVVALGMAVPLMYSAGAATPDEVATDCRTDSDKLENCQFVPVQNKRNSFGPNERVTTVTDNCGFDTEAKKEFGGTASVARVIQLEEGFSVSGDTKLGNSFFEVGVTFNVTDFNIKTDETSSSFTFKRSDVVKPDHIAFFMWSHKRTDVSGFLRATYKDAQDGQTVFFSPGENATTIHAFYPQLLSNGTPDGRLWLRNVQCGTPQANGILNSEGSVRAEPGFGEGGTNVTDVEVPLSDIAVQ
ncbi:MULTISPECIES: hypothetical protein [Streptomyces]|uniref:Secreted protein n=1 Tax=Streptomyces griseiscabiei TaxID=2993540 RepID=A0ABU4LK65_9ACTN|nr:MULTISPECIES: hypothetical protein [Streptomyces]MBZ3908145.1 hypothetical protein [Streptomyces griseiscabiei]MDX2915338.1 hypothetical protein [Streptomyces griseiscabiei]